MKASIITLHAVANYGSVLQTYATQNIFENLGFETEIVDYRRKAIMTGSIKEIISNSEFGLLHKIKLILLLPSIKKSKKTLGAFLTKHINLSEMCYHEDSDFEKYKIDADVYCTGSDQVWNTGWHNEIPRPFFLTYAPQNRRIISFSASFGKDRLDAWEKPEMKKLLERYDFISVREKSGVDILNDLGISGCAHVLDPTLTVKPEIWHNLAFERVVKEKYVLIYQLNKNEHFGKYAKEFAKRKNLKLIRLCTRYDQLKEAGHGIVLPKVEEFLALFRDAEYIITDSFHATAFSLIFHKQFINIFPKLYSTRLQSILQIANLENRKLLNYNDFDSIDNQIDYEEVDKLLDNEREKTINFLKRALDFNNASIDETGDS